ncbi:MAG: allantoinase AllB [Elusimicrobia bacterium]|nr:allantoinase AllB [Elusimicrobiota bacterium]
MIELAVRGRRVLTGEGLRPAAILVEDGLIAAVARPEEVPAGVPVREAGDLAVLPALVDAHVHVNEPGRTEWEGFSTATDAAAAGGVGTIVDMPLNCSPVTTSRAALETKLSAVAGKLAVDAAFWGGLVPGNLGELKGLAAGGVAGVKAFLTHSGLDEFPNVSRADLEAAMPVLAELDLPLIVHAELDPPGAPGGEPRRYASYLASRPPEMERRAIRLLIELCRATRCRTHVVHLSDADSLPDVERAKAEGLPFTVETCPHYLTFSAAEIPDGATAFKCAPPIRSAENRERLWAGLARGTIDFVVSDHSPCLPELKKLESGDFLNAWGGVAGLQFTLPALWSGAKRRGFELEDVARWAAEKTSAFLGLSQKGVLEKGRDADVLIFDDAALFDVEAAGVRHRHKTTPYLGRRLLGAVEALYLRGLPAFERERPAAGRRGRMLLRRAGGWAARG